MEIMCLTIGGLVTCIIVVIIDVIVQHMIQVGKLEQTLESQMGLPIGDLFALVLVIFFNIDKKHSTFQ